MEDALTRDEVERLEESGPPAGPSRRFGRALIRTLAVSLLIVLAAASALLWQLGRPLGHGLMGWAAEELASDAIVGELRVGRISGHPLWGPLRIEDIQIEGPDGHAALSIDSLGVQVALGPLLDQRVVVDHLHLHGVDVDPEALAAALAPTSRSPSAPEDPAGAPAWAIALRDLSIDASSVRLSNDLRVPLELDAAARFARERLHIERLELHAGPHHLSARGVLDLAEPTDSHALIARASADLVHLESLLGALPWLEQAPELPDWERVALFGAVDGRSGEVHLGALSPLGQVSVSGSVDVDARRYDLVVGSPHLRPEALPGVALPGPIEGGLFAHVVGQGWTPDEAAATLELRLGPLSGPPELPRGVLAHAVVDHGEADLRLDASWAPEGAGEDATLQLDARGPFEGPWFVALRVDQPGFEQLVEAAPIALPALEAGDEGVARVEGRVALEGAELRADLDARVHLASVEVGPPFVQGQPVRLGRTRLRAELPLRVDLDAGAVSLPASGVHVRSRDIRGPQQTHASTLWADGTFRLRDGRPAWDATLSATGLRYGGRDLGQALVRSRGRLTALGGLDVRIEALEALPPAWRVRLTRAAPLRIHPSGRIETDLALDLAPQVGGSVAVRGSFTPGSGRIDAVARLDDIELGAWVPLVWSEQPVSGRLDAEITVAGRLLEPALSGSLALEDARIGPRGPLALSTSAQLTAEEGGARVRAAGSAAWPGRGDVRWAFDLPRELLMTGRAPGRDGSARIAISGVDLEQLRDMAPAVPEGGRPLTGRIRASADLVLAGGVPRVAVELDGYGLDYDTIEGGRFELAANAGGDAVEVRGSLRGFEREVVHIEGGAELDLGDMAARGDWEGIARALRAKPPQVALNVEGLRLREVPLLEVDDPRLARAELTVVLEADAGGALRGDLLLDKLPVGDGSGRLFAELGTGADEAIQLSSRLVVEEAALAELRADLPGLEGLAQGPGPLEDERVSLHLEARALSPDQVRLVAPALAEQLTRLAPRGPVTLDLLLRGGAGGPSLFAKAHLAGKAQGWGEVDENRPRLLQSLYLSAEVRPDASRLQLRALQGAGSALYVDLKAEGGSRDLLEGGADAMSGVALSGRLGTRDMDARGLARLLPGVISESPGQIVGEVDIAGTVGRPEARGRLALELERLVLAATGTDEEDVTVALKIGSEGLELEPLELQDAKGRLRLSARTGPLQQDLGQVALEGAVELSGYQVMSRPDLRARAQGQITLDGTISAPELSGEVTLRDAYLAPQLGGGLHSTAPPADVVFVDDGLVVSRPAATQGAAMPVALDLKVIVPRGELRVKHDLVDARPWTPGISIRTEDGQLQLRGELVVDEGDVTVYGRKFELAKDSFVKLQGVSPVDPLLHVNATYDISEVDLRAAGQTATRDSKIMVRARGTASEPRVELASDPPLPKEQIVSIIVTGRPQGASGGQGEDLEGEVGNLVAGFVSGQLVGLAADDLSIDVLEVDPGEGSLTVGKRLSDGLTVVYEGRIDAEPEASTSRLEIRYRLGARVDLQTHFGDAGEGGVNVFYRYRY